MGSMKEKVFRGPLAYAKLLSSSLESSLSEKAKSFVAEKVGEMKMPSAEFKGIERKDISRDSAAFDIHVSVTNPYNSHLLISNMSYTLKSDGKMIAFGKKSQLGPIKGRDSTEIAIPVTVSYDLLWNLAKDIGRDWAIDCDLEVALTLHIPFLGKFTLQLHTKCETKLPTFSQIF